MAANGQSTVTSRSVPPYMENGRLYHGYKKGMYMFPCDEQEKDRLDMQHKFFSIARRDYLFNGPLACPPGERPEILDLGTGTGIWAIDMADKFPEAWVTGLDLAEIQPASIPKNLRFRIQDHEGLWTMGEGTKDLIHLRMGCGSVSHWPELYQKVFAHLRPGYGSFEQVEMDLQPRCDDGTMPETAAVRQWYNYLADATARADKPIQYEHNTEQLLQHAGFTDIRHQTIRIPVNTWSPNAFEKIVGRWWNMILKEGLGLEALSVAPLTRVFRWSHADVARLLKDVTHDICNKKMHIYMNM
ncbi:MAG: hypothetical protein M1824_005430 [Vezdaea acicularis]|nr:MAG: hypothetical protein M1824_005430 [Vezdaea acicularis]